MSWIDEVGGLLKQYSKPEGNGAEVENHFDQVAAAAPPSALGAALADMFRSNETPPFGQITGQLFGNSNGEQRASVLNTLLSNTGPALRSLLSSLGLSGGQRFSADVANQISPATMQQMAQHAEEHDPSVVDKLSEFYSQHPGLIKTLGGAALAITLAKLANRQQQ